MKRATPMRFIVCLCVLLAATNVASAAVWAWGCQAQVGGQQIIFNRFSMIVVDTKQKMGDIRNLRATEFDLPPGSPPSVKYESEDANGGFQKTMIFTFKADPARKVTLTEKTSRRISHSSRLICGRDEDTDVYRKVYSFRREAEPARSIIMQCMEYQLSTRGGRKGCDDD
ncbi:MAG TPA: hypothetical protein VIV34_06760 [Pseudolabrys sp.]